MTESQKQALANLLLAIRRCQQEGLKIWEITPSLRDALQPIAAESDLHIQITSTSL